MHFYLLDSFNLRLFKQKQSVHRLTVAQAVDLGTPAPPPTPKTPPRENERAHRFLDQMEAAHNWWVKPLPFMQPPAGKAAAPTEPIEPFALRELPDTEERAGLKTDAALMRQWFKNAAYAVQSKEQKSGAKGSALYPEELVNTSILKMDVLLKNARFKAVYDKIKSPDFLQSQPVMDALLQNLAWVQEYSTDLVPAKEFNGRLQERHRKYAFASLPVSKAFPEVFSDVCAETVDRSTDTLDDVALGNYRLHVAINNAHVFNNGYLSTRVRIDEVAVYVVAPYGLDNFGPELEYRGHANKKQFGVVVDCNTWMNDAVYTGEDKHAKNAPLRVITRDLFRQWRRLHNQGGDMLVFSDRKEMFCAPIDVIVPLKTPEELWYDYQKEAEAIVAPGGMLIADPKARNRAINAAYAKLWLKDNRFQWAGFAAFASKQVGCGLVHASDLMSKAQASMELVANSFSGADVHDQAAEFEGASSAYVYQQLALGNTTLFLDVYPLHRFFQDQGARKLTALLIHRKNLKDDQKKPILWPVESKVTFGLRFVQILNAFNAIEAGNIAQSVRDLAEHEQINILQPIMYDDHVFHALMRANQVSFATGFPSGVAEGVELTFASECKPLNDGRTIGFSQEASADLANPKQRMAFVLRAAALVDKLFNTPASKAQIVQSLQAIAAGGGVK